MLLLPPPKSIPFPEEWKKKQEKPIHMVNREIIITTNLSNGLTQKDTFRINYQNGSVFVINEQYGNKQQ